MGECCACSAKRWAPGGSSNSALPPESPAFGFVSPCRKKTGGSLTTFEYDAGRAATARGHFRQAGVEQIVTVVEGDAHQTISRLRETIDFLFIDADKEGYVDYLNRLGPLVRPGGLILAHNDDTSPEYQKLVTANPALETLFSGKAPAWPSRSRSCKSAPLGYPQCLNLRITAASTVAPNGPSTPRRAA